MEIGFVGLGRMGLNMVRRLVDGGHRVVGFDRTQAAVEEAVTFGAAGAATLRHLVSKLTLPRSVWIMVPAGEPTEAVIDELSLLLSRNDILIDGGNSNYHDTVRRSQKLADRGIRFLDAGTSGGIWGLKNGYCLMVGGDKTAFEDVEPAMKTLAPEKGCLYCGPSGAGHYAKMIHNGIEYGMLQAYAEGFEILHASQYEFDLGALAALWNRGSVIRLWLLELCESAFQKDPDLSGIGDAVADSGEGRWTVQEAVDRDVPAPVITLSLLERLRSRQEESFTGKVISALRREFGGHAVEVKEEPK